MRRKQIEEGRGVDDRSQGSLELLGDAPQSSKAKEGSPLDDNGHVSVSYRRQTQFTFQISTMLGGACPASSPLDSSARAGLGDEARISRRSYTSGSLTLHLLQQTQETRGRSRGERVVYCILTPRDSSSNFMAQCVGSSGFHCV